MVLKTVAETVNLHIINTAGVTKFTGFCRKIKSVIPLGVTYGRKDLFFLKKIAIIMRQLHLLCGVLKLRFNIYS
jgi:hypothetical protein